MQAVALPMALAVPTVSGAPVRMEAQKRVDLVAVGQHALELLGATLAADGALRAAGGVGHAALGGVDQRVAGPGGDLEVGGLGGCRPRVLGEVIGLGLALHDERALGAHDLFVGTVELVRFDRAEGGGAAALVLEGGEHVVGHLAALVGEAVHAARRVDRLGHALEEPVGDRHLVAAQLGQQAAAVLAVQAPVHQVIPVLVAPLLGIEVLAGRRFLAAPGWRSGARRCGCGTRRPAGPS